MTSAGTARREEDNFTQDRISNQRRMKMKDATKIAAFLTHTRVATRNEIASGCDISRQSAQAILDVIVAAHEVTRTGSEDNTATYSLAHQAPVAKPEPDGIVLTEREQWAINARKEGLEAFKRSHPEEYPAPTPRVIITDEQVEAELAKRKAVPLTPEEYAEALKRPKHLGNPQQFVR
jgi:hypothetical protein